MVAPVEITQRKYFVSRVDSLIDAYSDEETVCADRPEA